MANVRIEGLKELERKLSRMVPAVGGAHLLAAVDKGASVLEEGMRSLAPRLTGKGAVMITSDTLKSTRTRAEMGVGPGKAAFYLTFQETGTVDHPAQPFMRPALENLEDDIVDEIRDELLHRVLEVARGA